MNKLEFLDKIEDLLNAADKLPEDAEILSLFVDGSGGVRLQVHSCIQRLEPYCRISGQTRTAEGKDRGGTEFGRFGMQRLTKEKQIGPFASLKDEAEAVPGAFGTYDCLYAHMLAVTRLKEYEDTGLGPEEITTGKPDCVFYCNRRCNLEDDWCPEGPGCPREMDAETAMHWLSPPPNNPLTLDQLRELDGEPLWIRNHRTGAYTCRVIDSSDAHFTHFTDGGLLENRSYDLYWTTYRRRPEEVTQ